MIGCVECGSPDVIGGSVYCVGCGFRSDIRVPNNTKPTNTVPARYDLTPEEAAEVQRKKQAEADRVFGKRKNRPKRKAETAPNKRARRKAKRRSQQKNR